jgi:hypothetical protein
VAEVAFSDGTQSGRIDGCHCYCIACERHELDFVSGACVMNVNDRANVSCLESLTRQVSRQHNRIMFFDRHQSQAIRKKLMTEAAILEKIETLNQAVARLQQRVEDLEDLRDLEAAIAENAGKPLIPSEQVQAEFERE